MELHENLISFAIDGENPRRRVIAISPDWKTARLDDHVRDG
jgi:hypothetical protein